jgi:hypothetical protein
LSWPTIIRWLDLFRQWIAKRWFSKGVEAGKAQQRAELAAENTKRVERSAEKVIRERKRTLAELQEAREDWKSRHGL